MADQPGELPPDGEPPSAAPPPPNTGINADLTVDAPVRWSGSAIVPPPQPKKSLFARRKAEPEDDWGKTTPVDPWEGQDTPWDPMQIPVPEPVPMPPTRIEPPPPPPPPPPSVNRVPVQPRPIPAPVKKAPEKPLPPPRKRRRPLRTLGTFTLLTLVFCCGVPALFLWPAAGQYPVSAVLPGSVSDLDLRDDATSRRAAERLATELDDAKAFAGIYADGNGKRVTIFGTTGLRLTPKQDVEAQIQQLSTDYDVKDVQSFDMGETGVHERCGTGKAGRNTVVVCAWADHGSLVTVLMTRRSVADSADLTAVLRSAVLDRG
jgi:hypothetical protein